MQRGCNWTLANTDWQNWVFFWFWLWGKHTIQDLVQENAEIFPNYRPVSVLPCLCKILERLFYNRYIDYISKNNILNEKQFGFKPNHPTHTAIIERINKIVIAVKRN